MTAPRHVDVGAYVLGILDEPDEAAYEEHFAQCERCRREFIELADLPAILDTMKPTKPDAERKRRAAPALPPLDALIDFRQLAPPGDLAVPPQLRPAGATQPNKIPTNGTRTNGNGRRVGGFPISAGPAAERPSAEGTGRHRPVEKPGAEGPSAEGTGRFRPTEHPGPEGTGQFRPTEHPGPDGTGRFRPTEHPGPEGTGQFRPTEHPGPDGTGRFRSAEHPGVKGTGKHTPADRPGMEGTGRHRPVERPGADSAQSAAAKFETHAGPVDHLPDFPSLPRGETTGRNRGHSTPAPRAESTGRSTPVSRGDNTGRANPPSRPGNNGHAPTPRAETTGRSTPVSRAGGTGRSTPVSRPEGTERSAPVSRAESTGRSLPATRPSGTNRPPTKTKATTRRNRKPIWVAAAAVVTAALSVAVVVGLMSGDSGAGNQVANPANSANPAASTPPTTTTPSVAGAHVVSGTDPKSGVTAIITVEPVTGGTGIDVALYKVAGAQEGEIFVVSRFGDRERVAVWQAGQGGGTAGEAVRTDGVSAFPQHDISRFEIHGAGTEALLVVPI